MFKSLVSVAKVVVPIAVGTYVSYKATKCVLSLHRQKRTWQKLEGLSFLVDTGDVDLQECIEVVEEKIIVPAEGSTVNVPKGMRKNRVKKGRRQVYSNLVAQMVRAAYPNLGEGKVDREIARRKAGAIMAEHGMRASHVVACLPVVEALVFMRSERELEFEELKQSWWWFWTDRGLKPSRRA